MCYSLMTKHWETAKYKVDSKRRLASLSVCWHLCSELRLSFESEAWQRVVKSPCQKV